MSIDWGQLNNVQQPSRIVAQIPAQQGDTIGSALGGLANGIQQGMSIKGQMLQNQGQELQNAGQKTQNEMGELKLDQTKKGIAGQEAEQNAFKQSVEAGMNYLKQNNYSGYIDVQKNKAAYDKTVAETAKLTTETAQQLPQAIAGYKIAVGGSYASAMEVAQQHGPEAGQKQLDYNLGLIPESIRNSILPKEMQVLNETNYFTAVSGSAEAMDQMNKENAQKDAPANVKTAQRISYLQNQKNLTPEMKSELDVLTKQNANTSPTPIQSNLAKQDAIAAKEAGDSRSSIQGFNESIGQTRAQLAKVPDALLGPVQNLSKVARLNPDVQILASLQNSLALQAKELFKLGSGQGFTDADRDFLTEIVGNRGTSKQSVGQIMDRLEEIGFKTETRAWNRESQIRKQDPQTYDAWLEANPKPEKVKSPAQQASQQEQTKSIGGVNYIQKDGKWYQQ